MRRPEDLPGRLIVVEGCDGSGKSTQLQLLRRWLEAQGLRPFLSEWNSSELVHQYTKKAKTARTLTPTTFSLIHASDFADRYEKLVLPRLRAGYIVLADRYAYTAFARDAARGCALPWVRGIYAFAVRPDLALYFQAPLEVSVGRIVGSRAHIKYHEAGMDLGLSTDLIESFKLFQGRIKDRYDAMAEEEGLVIIDATRPIEEQQKRVRALAQKCLEGYEPPFPVCTEGAAK